jgi:hypothetical protein
MRGKAGVEGHVGFQCRGKGGAVAERRGDLKLGSPNVRNGWKADIA